MYFPIAVVSSDTTNIGMPHAPFGRPEIFFATFQRHPMRGIYGRKMVPSEVSSPRPMQRRAIWKSITGTLILPKTPTNESNFE